MSSAKVLVDLHRLKHNPYNGLYTFTNGLAQALAASIPEELEYYYYLPEDYVGQFGNDVQYVKHHSRDKYFLFGTRKYDAWHITTHLSWYRPFNRKTKIIYTIHDLNFLIEDLNNTERNTRLLKLIQQRINRADHITAISEYALNTVKEHLNVGNKTCSVVYNGADITEHPLFHSPRFRPQQKFLFAMGLVQPRKNFHTLPALLVGNDFELIIAGLNDFEYATVVRNAAAAAGVTERVHLIGAITEEEKYWYYKNCEAFLFPSVAEGFGLPAIEAMYHGKPVFLSTHTCMPEIGGDVAYYFTDFDPENMRKIFSEGMSTYNLEQPVEKIKARAAKFTWQKAAAQYAAIYKSLV